ncbi:ATP-binding protein [Hamadaea tsunoensis]|uniref:ATP-binding protein n=1 Tax=Hamadaea tsunoensis TaxID=53368 RepID=UPI000421F714|nr:tetratricopeptide repeat protein [Hamadaea tsunoensis]
MDDPVRALGRRLDAARRRRGWTFREFARHTGLSKSTLQYLVRTRRTAPEYHELTALVGKLGEPWTDEWEQLWQRAANGPDGTGPRPAQLPAEPTAFTGRRSELADLDRYAAAGRLTVLCGTAGVGKTALALRWAHTVRTAYPDGQLYVNLRGYDPGRPVTAADALGGFLRSLGVDGRSLPPGADERAALLRTLLAGKRLLLLLDNASTVEQVRPLLPGAGACFVLVTSRDELPGLAARDGAARVEVAPFATDTATTLLRLLIGPRVAADPAAAAALAAQCAGLPLALRVAAELAAGRPAAPLADLVAELADERCRLDLLDAGGDPHSVVRGVLSWSYRGLPVETARAFRRLGLHPGRTFGAGAAVTLTGSRALLDDLVRAHLVYRSGPTRYGLHDLLRAYAAELTRTVDSGRIRRAGVRRILDYYLHSAYAANVALEPNRLPISLPRAARSVRPRSFATAPDALAWFAAEHDNLMAAVDTARTGGFDEHTWRLAWTLMTYFERRGHWRAYAATHQVGLAAAVRLGDTPGQAHAHRCLARAYARLERLDDAEKHSRQALELYELLGDERGCARTLLNLSGLAGRRGRHAEAMTDDRRALELFRAAGDRHGEALALNQISCDHSALGEHAAALEHGRLALERFAEFADEPGQAAAWDTLGVAHHARAAYADAAACYARALALFRGLGDRGAEADTLTNLGDTHAAAGERGQARLAWRDALGIYEATGHARAADLQARLA